MFVQSMESGDGLNKFYTTYEREAARYDKAFVERHDSGLNVVIAMVRPHPFTFVTHLTCFFGRGFYIPPSARIFAFFTS